MVAPALAITMLRGIFSYNIKKQPAYMCYHGEV